MIIKIPKLECKRCGYKWTPRKTDVRICPNPKCHSVLWDKMGEEKCQKQRLEKDGEQNTRTL